MRIVNRYLTWVLAGIVLLSFSGCAARNDLPPSFDPALARNELDSLAVIAKPVNDHTYKRILYGDPWFDVDHNGCNTRVDVLYRDVVKTQPFQERRSGTCHHKVKSGSWYDPYTGLQLRFTNLSDPRQAEQIQIDHIVPLALAWRFGAKNWPLQRRIAFANDMDNLVAVSGKANQDKGDLGPDDWMPDINHCWYATVYIKVKYKYELPTTKSEKSALIRALKTC